MPTQSDGGMHPKEQIKEDKMSSTGSEIAGAQALPLSGLVNYQEGSVVSRVILKRDKGNVTLFAFDEGQGLSEHTLPSMP